MHGYDLRNLPVLTGRRHEGRRPYHHGTNLAFKETRYATDRLELWLRIHPAQVRQLGMKQKERWTLVPWADSEETTVEERQQRQGTLALLRYPDSCPGVKLCSTGWATWRKVLPRNWVEDFILSNQPVDTGRLLIPETRIQQEGNEIALVIDPGAGTFVASPYSRLAR